MSAVLFSAFDEIDLLFKQERNLNAIHFNSMLDKKAVGVPLATSSSTNNCSYAPGFSRSNSSHNVDTVINSNKCRVGPCSNLEEVYTSVASTAVMNKENKFRDRTYSDSGERSQKLQEIMQLKPGSQINSTRYKTELCRPFEENGACKYGEKCQFAHGYHELRNLSRHPKYKTEPCRTFHTIGFCPYGPRCHFIHNADERRLAPCNTNAQEESTLLREQCGHRNSLQHGTLSQRDRPTLNHSLSFAGFSSHSGHEVSFLENPASRTPPPSSLSSCSSNLYEDLLSPSPMSCVNGAFNFPGQDLKSLFAPLAINARCGYGDQSNGAFYRNPQVCPPSPPYKTSQLQSLRRHSHSPGFESPPSPPDSISDRESYVSGSPSSSGSSSGSESPSLDAGKRLPIFSRLSVSDD